MRAELDRSAMHTAHHNGHIATSGDAPQFGVAELWSGKKRWFTRYKKSPLLAQWALVWFRTGWCGIRSTILFLIIKNILSMSKNVFDLQWWYSGSHMPFSQKWFMY